VLARGCFTRISDCEQKRVISKRIYKKGKGKREAITRHATADKTEGRQKKKPHKRLFPQSSIKNTAGNDLFFFCVKNKIFNI
jgi:hypothetical protein